MTPNRSGGADSSSAYPIKIRKDKPFVLEFSGKPDVQFMSPDKSRSFRPGDNIYIGAMLNEPWQGLQITGLWDTTDKKGEQRYYLDGKLVSSPSIRGSTRPSSSRARKGKRWLTAKCRLAEGYLWVLVASTIRSESDRRQGNLRGHPDLPDARPLRQDGGNRSDRPGSEAVAHHGDQKIGKAR